MRKLLFIMLFFGAFMCIPFYSTYALEIDPETGVPPIIPNIINQKADQELANLEKLFGPHWSTVINATQAIQNGDIETFYREGKKILSIVPEIMPKFGLDLIFPINENYLGPIKIDPTGAGLDVKIDNQDLEIRDLQSLDAQSLLFNLALRGYDNDTIEVRDYFNESILGLKASDVEFKTEEAIKLDKGELTIVDKNRDKETEVKNLPSKALREIESRYKNFEASEINLKLQDSKATYDINGEINGKVFWIFPVVVDMTAEYDATNGALKNVKKPWWELFVF